MSKNSRELFPSFVNFFFFFKARSSTRLWRLTLRRPQVKIFSFRNRWTIQSSPWWTIQNTRRFWTIRNPPASIRCRSGRATTTSSSTTTTTKSRNSAIPTSLAISGEISVDSENLNLMRFFAKIFKLFR